VNHLGRQIEDILEVSLNVLKVKKKKKLRLAQMQKLRRLRSVALNYSPLSC
jgi:hypothetical protein